MTCHVTAGYASVTFKPSRNSLTHVKVYGANIESVVMHARVRGCDATAGRASRCGKNTPISGKFRAFFATRTILYVGCRDFQIYVLVRACHTTGRARDAQHGNRGLVRVWVARSYRRMGEPSRALPNARLGVDISHWFHASVYPSVEAFVRCPSANLGHVERIVQRASRLRQAHGFDPIFVFDGASLPSKSAEHAKRAEQRTAALLRANQEREARPDGATEIVRERRGAIDGVLDDSGV